MRQVSWETGAGALLAMLDATTQCYMVDLYTVTLSGGTVLRYSGGDTAVVINGNTFALGPLMTRGRTKVAVGVAVDSLDVTFNADTTVLVNGVPLLQFIANGGLDGARIVLERAFATGPGAAWVGTIFLFGGLVGEPKTSRYAATVPVNSDSALLNVMVPATLFQPGCSNTLFDSTCGLVKSAYATATTATSASDAPRTSFSTALAQATGYFALGFVVGVTGANAGVSRTVKSFSGGTIQTVSPWPTAVANGDTFTIYPGCDKLQLTCSGKFSNLLRFRGYPYVPAPETVL